MRRLLLFAIAPALCAGGLEPSDLAAQGPAPRITILTDAFSRDPRLERDWGFAALVEYGGRRILFDTGNDGPRFAVNVRALGIDLGRLDAVVISHRHGDHTSGLRHLLAVNPGVTIYAPDDEYFGGATPAVFFSRPDSSLPREMRYFDGVVPDVVPHGTPWTSARVRRVRAAETIAPGFRVVANRAPDGAFSETPELSLVIDTPEGPVVLVGCSHPGIERILASIDPQRSGIRLLAGGLHLVATPDAEIARLVGALRDERRVRAIAPGHCTGERAFAALRRAFGAAYAYAGVGTTVVPPDVAAGDRKDDGARVPPRRS